MKLLVCISSHGYGHAAQTAAVVNVWMQRQPDTELILRTALPQDWLRIRFDAPFQHIAQSTDFGMAMDSAVDVRLEESLQRYIDFHAHWEEAVQQEARDLCAIAPDLLLANVPYLPLAGAKVAGIKAVALCSLNWADILASYAAGFPHLSEVIAQIRAAYQGANAFICCTPAMPMTELQNQRRVGPIARIGVNKRAEIIQQFSLSENARLVLVAPGGLPMELPVDQWPKTENLVWLVQSNWKLSGPNIISLEQIPYAFIDVLASVDVLVGKPGYGSVSEAVCNGIPFIYLKRGDWPEEPYLLDWLHRHGRGHSVERAAFYAGDFLQAIEDCLQIRPDPMEPVGVLDAVKILESYI